MNLAMIGGVFFLSPHLSEPITGLAIGVIIGGVLQLLLQIPFIIRKGIHFWKKTRIYHTGLKKVGMLMLPTIFGAAVYQINIMVGTLLASLLPEGSVSYLYYADRLVQFPLGIFAIATATAVLPSLSRQAAAEDFAGVRETFAHAMNMVFFITIPSMVGLIILREPIISLLFKRGAFDAETTRLTATALLYYGIGLWAFSAVRIVVSTFYALQDTKTPVRMAVVSVIANIVLGVLLMGPLGHGGLALSTSLASMLNLVLLIRALRVTLGSLELKSIKESVCKTLVSSAMMGAVVWAVSVNMIRSGDGTLSSLLFWLMGSIIIGFLFYGAFSFLIKSPELNKVWVAVKKGVRKS